MGIAIGTYRGGILGGLIAWLGFTLPSAGLLAALYDPVWISVVKQPADFVTVLVCFTLLQFCKLPTWSVVLVSCGLTLLFGTGGNV